MGDLNAADDEAVYESVRPPMQLLTLDSSVTNHAITDDQLTMLAQGGKDKSFDIAIAAAALAIGLSQNVYSVLADIISSKSPSGKNVIAGIIFVVAVTTTVIKALSYRSTKQDTDALVERIKENEQRHVFSSFANI